MYRLLLSLVVLFSFITEGAAQFGSFGDVPIAIDSDDTTFEGGIAAANGNVIIRYNDVTIYCDYATYNPQTRDVLLNGSVRIYRLGQLFTGDRALYNLETKALSASGFLGEFTPFRVGSRSISSMGNNGYFVQDGIFTTSDSSKPDYHLRARSVRVYPGDRVVFSNVTLVVGRTPVFWFPYLYQSLNQEVSFSIMPGYSNVWGAHLLGQYTFPLTENISGRFRLDLLSRRGVGVGFDAQWPAGRGRNSGGNQILDTVTDSTTGEKRMEPRRGENWGRFRSYYIEDKEPGLNRTGNSREPIDPSRYRISLQDRTYFTDDIYSTVDINKLSDRRFLQDFMQGEFRQNPNPDNMVTLTKWGEDYTVTILGRKQLNEDQDGTERMPELSLDFARRPIFGKSGLYYEGETTAGFLRRNYARDSLLPDYETFRADSFHQLLYPTVLGGWLSLVPRVGLRGTYYQNTGFTETRFFSRQEELPELDAVTGDPIIDPVSGLPLTRTVTVTDVSNELRKSGSVFRTVLSAGFESSFKLSRTYEQVQSRAFGLDGLRHVLQPFMNLSLAWTSEEPDRILQFDSLRRSTQLPPIDFPQFNTTDSIDNWAILRLGTRNRFQTRRDNATFTWLEWNTFFDVNFQRPDYGQPVNPDDGTFSNLVNRLRWTPLPWVNLQLDSQLPVFDAGFTEVNTQVNFLATRNMQFNIGHRYMSGNRLFNDSNLINFGGYIRFNDNWAFSFRDQYEFQDQIFETQRYEVHRDLSSWVASLGMLIRRNDGNQGQQNDVGLMLTFTLKDIPNARIPLALDPGGGSGTGRNR